MPEQVLKLQFDWENGVSFTFTSKFNDDDAITIVQAEENTCFAPLWDNFKEICLDYISRNLDIIGNDMKA